MTKTQAEFDWKAAAKAAEKGIERAHDHAEMGWVEHAHEAILRVAMRKAEFNSDDVLAEIPEDVETHDRRALGSIMRSAARAGVIEKTGRFSVTSHVTSHQRPKAVWRSLVHQAETESECAFCLRETDDVVDCDGCSMTICYGCSSDTDQGSLCPECVE